MKKQIKLALILAALFIAGGLSLWALDGALWQYETLGYWNVNNVAAVDIYGGSAHVRVYETDDDRLEVTAEGLGVAFSARLEGDRLSVSCQDGTGVRGLLQQMGDDPELIVWLPRQYSGALTASTDSGEVNFHGAELSGGAYASTNSGAISVYDSEIAHLSLYSGSGDIYLGDVRMSGDLTMDSGSGDLYAYDVRGAQLCRLSTDSGYVNLEDMAPETLQLSTGSGEQWLEDFTAHAIHLTSASGSVYARLEGSMDDYSIQTATLSGSSNLPRDYTGGAKTLTISTDSGDIDVAFE